MNEFCNKLIEELKKDNASDVRQIEIYEKSLGELELRVNNRCAVLNQLEKKVAV